MDVEILESYKQLKMGDLFTITEPEEMGVRAALVTQVYENHLEYLDNFSTSGRYGGSIEGLESLENLVIIRPITPRKDFQILAGKKAAELLYRELGGKTAVDLILSYQNRPNGT